MNRETWKWIPGYERRYEVSTQGRVRSWVCSQREKPKILRSNLDKDGYVTVMLFDAKGPKLRKVHRLVALTFLGPPPSIKHEVNHKGKNGDKTDNRLENLEWVTSKQNKEHAIANGLNARGSRQHRAKLSQAEVEDIIDLLAAGRIEGGFLPGLKISLAKKYGVSKGLICNIANDQSWRYLPKPWRVKPS